MEKVRSRLWLLQTYPHQSIKADPVWPVCWFSSIFLAVSISPSTLSVIKICCLCQHQQIADGGKQIPEQWWILTWTRNNWEPWCPLTSMLRWGGGVGGAGLVSAERGCWCWCPLRTLMDSTASGDCHRPSHHTSDPKPWHRWSESAFRV